MWTFRDWLLAPNQIGAPSFRVRLRIAMMLVVSAITGATLYFAQRGMKADEVDEQRTVREQFKAAFANLLGVQAAHRAMIAERCSAVARDVRTRAAFEDENFENAYVNAAVEMRALLESAEPGLDASSLRATFFRFLDANGAVLPPPGNYGGSLEFGGEPTGKTLKWVSPPGKDGGSSPAPLDELLAAAWDWGAEITALRNLPTPLDEPLAAAGKDEQQVGYIAVNVPGAGTRIDELVSTPIRSTDTDEVIGALALGFRPAEFGAEFADAKARSGIWFGGRLNLPSLDAATLDLLGKELMRAAPYSSGGSGSFAVTAGGAPHLLFYKRLNPGSRFPPAYEICLYPLTDEIARQQRLRWKILGAGALLLCGGLVASHLISGRFSAPVEQLAVDSAENRVGRELAEAELELTYEELVECNVELQVALVDLKTTQQQIIQQERLRALGQMASGIAHDFNNSLVPIIGFCELLQTCPEILADPPKTLTYLETIHTAAKDAASVVSRLREFYRADKRDIMFTPVDLKGLIEQTLTLTRPKWKQQAQAAGVTIDVALDLKAVPPIAGEQSALREALTNIIFNAVDAMPVGGTLTFRTRHQGDTVVLEVTDSGTGMTEEVRERCLEPFFSTKGESGTGLGLSMVFGIVQRHSGLMEISSVPGDGTTFVIKFPVMDAIGNLAAEAEASRPNRALRVLVVDDEAPVRGTLAAMLLADGHTVELSVDGVEGLQRFGAGHFDLVITDKAMPKMNGDQMAAAIKRVAPQTPIILLTGFALFYDKKEFPDIDVLASKPVRIAALREAIATATPSP
jgi:signal transduction histidine kinase